MPNTFLEFLLKCFFEPLIKKQLPRLKKKWTHMGGRKKIIILVSVLLLCLLSARAYIHFSGVLQPSITSLMLSNKSMSIQVGDVVHLSATAVYSDNTYNKEVYWLSSNKNVATVDESGQVMAIAEGTATVIAQASNQKSSMQAECLITVTAALSGYTISVVRTSLDNYVYIYVQPNEKTVIQIQLYALAPSGQVFRLDQDKNDLYHIHTEAGLWTVYATLKSSDDTYVAQKPEDYISFEVQDISSDTMDALLAGLPVY